LQIDAGKPSGFGFENYFQFRQATPLLEKIIPERAALIKQKQNAMKKSLPESFSMFDDAFDPAVNKAPEKMIANAANTLPQMRGMMYKGAIDEAVKSGSIEKAREALNQTPAGKERDDALAYLDSKIAETKIKDGKTEEARKLIDQLSSKKEKIERIVQLAINFQAKNTKEDKEFALKLMDEARRLTDDLPQDEDAINDYLRVAGGYAYVDPNTAFSCQSS
jgi:thioredoxin-like negative regulator of GroEL